jgi:hypothetical protein
MTDQKTEIKIIVQSFDCQKEIKRAPSDNYGLDNLSNPVYFCNECADYHENDNFEEEEF